VRFAGEPGEQMTMFLRDPSGNALEFKSFRNADGVFRK
jgi:extradiol dioxygenase family protein